MSPIQPSLIDSTSTDEWVRKKLKDKNVTIVGSGCTAITMAPSIIKDAKKVTLVQRSPAWIININSKLKGMKKSKALSWRVSILKDPGMSQTQYAVCIKRQSQSQLIVRSAVITSVMSVLLCREMSGELLLSGAGHDSVSNVNHSFN